MYRRVPFLTEPTCQSRRRAASGPAPGRILSVSGLAILVAPAGWATDARNAPAKAKANLINAEQRLCGLAAAQHGLNAQIAAQIVDPSQSAAHVAAANGDLEGWDSTGPCDRIWRLRDRFREKRSPRRKTPPKR